MSGPYPYTSMIWPSVLTVLLLIALSIYACRRRSVPGALPFAIACLPFALWMAGYTLLIAAIDAAKIFWFKFGSVWQMFGITAVTCFLLEYAWPGRWLTRRNLALLSIPPLLIMGLILTDDLHHLVLRGLAVDGLGVTMLLGPASRVGVAYGVGLVLVNLVVFAWLFVRSPQHRWPVVLMLTGQIVGRVAYVAHVGEAIQSELHLNVLGVALAFVMYAIALFGFRLFDPIVMARQRVIEQLHSGMLVLDPQGQVISLNPGAGRILGAPAGDLKGQRIGDLLPTYPDGPLDETEEAEIELCLPEAHSQKGDAASAGPAVRHYVLAISPLKDWRGLEAGRLLLLRDVTAQKQAQAHILEQQRALAMLHERESLARELHDDLGQVMGFASLKMGATRKLIADGKLAKADDQLAHLESIITQSHADVREYILNLRAAPTEERPFFSALQDYVDGFCQNYGMQVECSIGAGVDEGLFAQDAQMQVFRIIQEAFSNARKHAGASCVQVSFEMQDGRVRIRVQDDGRGFDPQQATGAAAAQTPGGHFGLRFMRERAEQLGGVLRVDSAPGKGTCVELTVPVEGKI